MPRLWVVVDKASQKHLNALVHTFALAIYLWVVCCHELEFGAKCCKHRSFHRRLMKILSRSETMDKGILVQSPATAPENNLDVPQNQLGKPKRTV
jgi:hypothetical protein